RRPRSSCDTRPAHRRRLRREARGATVAAPRACEPRGLGSAAALTDSRRHALAQRRTARSPNSAPVLPAVWRRPQWTPRPRLPSVRLTSIARGGPMRSRSRRTLRRAAPLAALALASLPVVPATADTLFPFTALLNGAQETPPVNSPSQGVGFFTLNKETDALCYAISFSPLGGTELVAHIHGPGAPGQAAPILHNISPSPSPLGSPKHGCVTLTNDEVGLLKKGLLYANVHSSIATNGEIRGQILPTKGVKYAKVPPIGSPCGAFVD